MPVNSRHPEYESSIEQWERCRDVYNGSDAVKEAGPRYLPPCGGQSNEAYQAYKKRAMFFGAMKRTVAGYVGSIARKPPKLTAPDALMFVEDDITGTGIGLLEFSKIIAQELLITGRAGLLTEWDEITNRPFLSCYRAEQMINWLNDGSVVFEETVIEAASGDPFKVEGVPQWRHLGLDEEGFYTVNVWRKKSGPAGEEFYIHATSQPTIRNMRLTKVPFRFVGCSGATAKLDGPPLLDLADIVLSHYMTSADLEHGRHFTALPTLFISGIPMGSEGVSIGGDSAILLEDPHSKVGYAEFSGAGLESLSTGLEQKEHQMAVLGAQLLGGRRAGVEAAETARIRTSGETSLLSGIVSACEEVIESALVTMAEWMMIDSKIDLHINRDFVGQRLAAEEITALVKAYVSNAITLEAFLHNLQAGEILPAEMTIDDQAAEIKALGKEAAAAAVKEPGELAVKESQL